MTNTLRQIRRLHPLLRGLILVYLGGTLLLVAAHQHHSALEGHDCALCTAAHTPAVISPALDHDLTPAKSGTLVAIPAEHGWETESHRTNHSRAPPLV